MAKHIVRNNGFKYIFHDDETYDLYRSGKGYFDARQQFRNRSNGRLCPGKQPFVEADDRSTPVIPARTPQHPTLGEQLKERLKEEVDNQIEYGIRYALDWAIYEKAVPFFKKKAIPYIKEFYNNATGKADLKVNHIVKPKEISPKTEVQPSNIENKSNDTQTDDARYRVFVHYLGLLKALNDLKETNPDFANQVIDKLCDSATIERVNIYLQNNPQILLEQEKELSINLGRKLMREGVLIPIQVTELKHKIQKITHVDMEDDICQ